MRPGHINIRTMKEKFERALEQRQKQRVTDDTRIPSAVLIPLYEKGGEYYIVFIRRTETVKTHKGQISFPGGMRDPGDTTLMHTAVRESREEIGLKKKDIRIIGELDDELTTTSNYIVTPFVGMIPWPYNFQKNINEVAEILEIPVKELLQKGYLKADTESLHGKSIDSYKYFYGGRVIWGATARILKKLLDIISQAGV